MWKLAVPLCLLLIGAALALITDKPDERADFVYINRGDISTLDPQRMSWQHDLRAGRALFEGLVRHDIHSADYRLVPALAESWDISADGLTYTFNLRPTARWSNGAPVTSGDLVYSWRRAILPDTACDYTQQFLAIKGARDFFHWRSRHLRDFNPATDDAVRLWQETERRFADTVALSAPDDHTLRVELEHPTPYFLDLCGFAVFYPVYPPLVRQFETLDPATGRLAPRSGWTHPGIMVSNGPFVLTRWRFKRDIRMERNPLYWDAASIHLRSILIPTIADPNAQVLAFRTGAADWVADVTPDYRGDLVADKHAFHTEHADAADAHPDPIERDRSLPRDPRNTVHVFPAFGTYFYNFNCSPKLLDGRDNPFHDPRVRRAFTMSIDRDRVVKPVRRVGERPAQTIVPPDSIPGYDSPRGLPDDPAAARALLAEAGYPGGRGFITVEILFNSDGGHDKIAQAVAKDWEENLGVAVTLRQREIKVFRNDLKSGNFIVSRGSWFGDYGDPTTFLNINRRDDGNNDRKFDSPEFESLLDAADRESDPARRSDLLTRAETLLVERDLPLAPIFQYVNVFLFDPHAIDGISSHPRQLQNPHHVRRLDAGASMP